MLTGGGIILQIPDISALGLIFAMKPSGSAHSSPLGWYTGHSGGRINSSNVDIADLNQYKDYNIDSIVHNVTKTWFHTKIPQQEGGA